eukprot:TRINITY_DN45140_c0_g1_i3.p1 TRINITY_DN45140_c0_g1~~TRINITY_DN45140_c0_g1_i3.p1  ORF type:complete len:311 (-),score=34.67 TRINITY_DN45140_c0_g1_i3:75-1007(-)
MRRHQADDDLQTIGCALIGDLLSVELETSFDLPSGAMLRWGVLLKSTNRKLSAKACRIFRFLSERDGWRDKLRAAEKDVVKHIVTTLTDSDATPSFRKHGCMLLGNLRQHQASDKILQMAEDGMDLARTGVCAAVGFALGRLAQNDKQGSLRASRCILNIMNKTCFSGDTVAAGLDYLLACGQRPEGLERDVALGAPEIVANVMKKHVEDCGDPSERPQLWKKALRVCRLLATHVDGRRRLIASRAGETTLKVILANPGNDSIRRLGREVLLSLSTSYRDSDEAGEVDPGMSAVSFVLELMCGCNVGVRT